MSGLELWGGVECTVNRVGDAYSDQVERTGHGARLDDLDRVAALGVRAVRYPVLWERTAPRGPASADFAWADARMERLRALGLRVIVGLVHHGSGPAHTDLLDEGFVEGLAAFARAVAERYPWVEDYTPVNEPLTTARFSALYGHWHPHRRDPAAFARALLTETRATAAAMRAIRAVTPGARLVQTEDLGRTFATPTLGYQADFENERRWLSLDLLDGRVGPGHALYRHLLRWGVGERELLALRDAPCPADLVGVNYYVTSDRFLDERVARYPAVCRGGNGRHVYCDVEAVRARPEGIVGHRALLRETWERYRTPVAVTEAHLGCTPEEQIRWLVEAWEGAAAARRDGADVRAVTLWSLFGAYDWDSLVTQRRGHYEPGAYDVRGPSPRPTALAAVARELGSAGASRHPLLALPGWWRRPERLLHDAAPTRPPARAGASPRLRPIVITGGAGTLAQAFARACAERGLDARPLTREQFDVADPAAVARVMDELRPWLVINAAGVVRRGGDDGARRANVEGPRALARSCRAREVGLVTFSSPFVFDGEKDTPYVETDPVAPRCDLGSHHADAERLVGELHPGALVVRTANLFGPGAARGTLALALAGLRRGQRVLVPDGCTLSPTYAPDLAHACLDLAIAGASGAVHLTNDGEPVSLVAWLRRLCDALGIDPAGVVPTEGPRVLLGEAVPRQASLGSLRAARLCPLDGAVDRYAREARAGA
jgi:dTDP-4-dehydrorhamnose reductase